MWMIPADPMRRLQNFSCRHLQGHNWSVAVAVSCSSMPAVETRPWGIRQKAVSLQCLLPFSAPIPQVFPSISNVNLEPVQTRHHTRWILIKSWTVLSYTAPVGLGSRKERARLDRSCFYQRGWRDEGGPGRAGGCTEGHSVEEGSKRGGD